LLPLADRSKEIAIEINAVHILKLEEPAVAFVTSFLRTIAIPREDVQYFSVSGEFYAIVMPMYSVTVANCAGFNTVVLAREGRRVLEALIFMHSKDLVHMDVKGNNIFVDHTGSWFLGDFGSCTHRNDLVTSCSEMFYFEKVLNKPALPKYDFYMLMVTLLIETLPRKHDFVSELTMKGSFMNREVVVSAEESIFFLMKCKGGTASE
jgi:hypothetical protein